MLVFKKSEEEATQIMLQVHNNGMGVCGVYTAEVAETKVSMVARLARNAGFPLRCSMEEV
jgi:ATP-dependent Clp protease adaptor protein ClpS